MIVSRKARIHSLSPSLEMVGTWIRCGVVVLICLTLCSCWAFNVAISPLTPDQVSRSAYGSREQLLYYMDLGITHHYAGNYVESNLRLQEAEKIGEELYTKSVAAIGASFLLNDYLLAYRGEDFELALIHMFMAMNYAKLGKAESALVEARKLDSRLHALNASYPDDKKNVYKEDALIRFLSGVLHEMEGNIDDANVDYLKSLEIFEYWAPTYGTAAPMFVVENLLSVADGGGFSDRVAQYQDKYPNAELLRYKSKQLLSEVIVVHYHGKSPIKVSQRVPLGIADGVVMTVSYPKYQFQPRTRAGATVAFVKEDDGKKFSCKTELMENVEAIAQKDLQNRLVRNQVKAIARLTAQYFLVETQAKEIRKKHGENAEKFFRITAGALREVSSSADTRSCRSLPAEIRVGRAIVLPGEYTPTVTLPNGTKSTLKKFKVGAGEKEFVILRSVD